MAVIGFCLIFLVAGIWRHQSAQLKIERSELRHWSDQEKEITLLGVVVKEPDIRLKSIKLAVKVEEMGRVLVTTGKYPEYEYGDKLKITGKLKLPQEFEDFNYKDYLAKDGIYVLMYWPEIEILAQNQGNFIYSKILSFKNKLRESIYSSLSPPQSSILGAIVLGDKRRISEEWKNKLNVAGVRHITCVSGMHIIILSQILMWLGARIGLWRGQAFYFAIILLVLFIIMVGAPASAIRAGIMGGLLLLAQKIGRLRTGGRAITIAATFMLVQNPLLLKADVGFQLSFLATLGIIYLMPIFQSWLAKIHIWRFKLRKLKSLLVMTLAAQIFTLPLLIYNFGYFSLVAPITNILLVPILPYVMVSGFVFSLSGLLWQTLGWVLSWPAWFLLSYLVKIVDWFSQIPWASVSLEISWLWLIPSYLILGCFTYWLVRRQRWKFLEY